MNTIRIGRLVLKCRGLRPGVAQNALGELPSALSKCLRDDAGRDASHSNPIIRIARQSTPRAAAEAVAARVAATVRARLASGRRPPKT